MPCLRQRTDKLKPDYSFHKLTSSCSSSTSPATILDFLLSWQTRVWISLANCRGLPALQASVPALQASFPVAKSVLTARQSIVPILKSVLPALQISFPVFKSVLPVTFWPSPRTRNFRSFLQKPFFVRSAPRARINLVLDHRFDPLGKTKCITAVCKTVCWRPACYWPRWGSMRTGDHNKRSPLWEWGLNKLQNLFSLFLPRFAQNLEVQLLNYINRIQIFKKTKRTCRISLYLVANLRDTFWPLVGYNLKKDANLFMLTT